MKIVIVDDDFDIGEILKIALEDAGYEIVVFHDGETGLNYLNQNECDMILLDITMPNLNGYELCNAIRKNNDVPILFISCLDDDESLTKALALGGDDYIRKPFSISEVIARISAHMRRYQANAERQAAAETAILNYRLGPYNFYIRERYVDYYDNHMNEKLIIRLSPLESDILTYFAENSNIVLTYKAIYESVWKETYYDEKGTIMVRVSSLRNKLPDIDIESIRGVGYQLNEF